MHDSSGVAPKPEVESGSSTRNVAFLMWFTVGLFFLSTRLPYLSAYFYNTDATQLGLGVAEFDLARHQPHPPGYLLYVLLARGLAAFGLSAEMAYQVLSLVMTGLGLVGVYQLTRRFAGMTGAFVALAAGLFHPYVWGYGVIGESYSAEFAVCTWIGVLVVDAWRGSARAALLSGLFLGLAGGIRTSVSMFMFFMWAAALLSFRHSWRIRWASVLAGVLGTALWLVPTAWAAGGLEPFLLLTRNLTTEVIMRSVSPIFGVEGSHRLGNVVQASWWACICIAVPCMLSALLLAVGKMGRRPMVNAPDRPPAPSLRLLLLLWTLPAMAFYLLVFASKPGYMLTFAAPFLAMLGVSVERAASRFERWGGRLVAAGALSAVLLHSVLFFSSPLEIELGTGMNAVQLEASDIFLDSALKAVELERRAEEGETIVIANSYLVSWRRFMYYVPDVFTYHLLDNVMIPSLLDRVDACIGWKRTFECASGPGFWTTMTMPEVLAVPIPSNTGKLVVFCLDKEVGRYEGAVRQEPWRLQKKGIRNAPYLVIDMRGVERLNVGGFTFFRSVDAAGQFRIEEVRRGANAPVATAAGDLPQ